MIFPHPVAAACAGLPRNRAMRARLKPHLDADPDLLAALLVHLEHARDDLPAELAPAMPGPLKSDRQAADTYPDGRARAR